MVYSSYTPGNVAGFGNRFGTHRFLTNPVPVPAPQPKTKIVNIEADRSGCGHWRMLWPAQIMNAKQNFIHMHLSTAVPDARFYEDVCAVRIQRQVTPQQEMYVQFLRQCADRMGFRLIYEIDDVMFREDIPDYNAFKFAFEPDEIRMSSERIMRLCHDVTVTCPYLRDYYRRKLGKQEITVVPNFPPKWWIGNFFSKGKASKQYDDNKKKPRVLYPGAGAHFDVTGRAKGKDDFEDITKYVIDTRKEFQWVFFGTYPKEVKQYVDSGEIEFHSWVNILEFPEKISKMEVQAMVAPLAHNEFNRGKSDIKLIEGYSFGLPVIAQDIITYKDAPADSKFNTGAEMIERLRENLRDGRKYKEGIDVRRAIAESRFLERPENIGCWEEVITTPFGGNRPLLSKWQ